MTDLGPDTTVRRRRRKLPEATQLARAAVQVEPSAPNYLVLSVACASNGDFAGAASAIEQAMKLDPGNPKYVQMYEMIQEKR